MITEPVFFKNKTQPRYTSTSTEVQTWGLHTAFMGHQTDAKVQNLGDILVDFDQGSGPQPPQLAPQFGDL